MEFHDQPLEDIHPTKTIRQKVIFTSSKKSLALPLVIPFDFISDIYHSYSLLVACFNHFSISGDNRSAILRGLIDYLGINGPVTFITLFQLEILSYGNVSAEDEWKFD